MKRDIHQEMTEAANKYAQSITDAAGVQSMLSIAFCEGVRWADKNHADENQISEARRKFRIEVAEVAKQFLPDCSFNIEEAFSQAEWLVLHKYSYIQTGEIIKFKNKR